MSETLRNIELQSGVWTNVRALSDVGFSSEAALQNTGVTDLYYSFSESEPSKSFDRYQILKRGEVKNLGTNKVWVVSPYCDGLANVQDLTDVISSSQMFKLNNSLLDVACTLKDLAKEVKLLNLRFEESFRTGINREDL